MTTLDDRLSVPSRMPGDVVCLLAPDGQVRYVSASVERTLGFGVEAFSEMTLVEIIHPDDVSLCTEQWRLVRDTPAEQVLWEARIRHREHGWRWMEVLAANRVDDPAIGALYLNFRDVTERKEAEAALRASEERLRALLQHSRDVHGLLDATGTVIWASPGLEDMLGWRADDIIGCNGFELVHPDDLDAALTRFVQSLQPEQPDPVELRLAHADGRWVPIEVAGSLWPTGDGEDIGLVINLRDISWRVDAERALRRSEERFRALVQHSHDGIVVLTADRGVTFASPSLEHLFGRPASEMIGLSGLELVHPDDLQAAAEALSVTASTVGHRATLQVRVQHADGGWRWVECTAVNLTDNEAVEGVVINIRDITDRREAQESIRESERVFRSLAQSSPTGVYLMLPNGECTYVNERFQEITGYSPDDAMAFGWHRMVHPDDREEVGAVPSLDEISREPLKLEFRVVRPDGTVRWVSVSTGPMFDDSGTFQGSVGTLDDITDRMEATQDSRRLTDIFEATHDLVAIADRHGALLYLNQAARRFFGVGADDPLDSFDLVGSFGPEMVDRLATQVQPSLEAEGIWFGELPIQRPDGTVVPHRAQLLAHRNEHGHAEFFSAMLHDISERKAIEHRLAHQATHDPLTGLPNRTLLLDRLDQALRRARRNQRRVAVLFLDLDHFKVVNDSLGHGLGDRLLISIAGRLQKTLRPADTVARFGGDEFVVLCEDLVSQQDAVAIAERVNDAISGPFVIDDAEVFVGVSIGIAFPDDNEADPETLIRDADAAMYQAKDRGRARWVIFDNAMRASAVDRLDIENALRRAIDRRELRVYYQPIVDLQSGVIAGVEALLRWEHPERGLLLPNDFIGVAEETGLIVPIGSWVLDQACRQVQRWHASQPDLPALVLAVNLSGRQLGHPRLVDDVATVLADTGVDPSHVELEITESVLMDDVEMSEDTLGRLKTLGVKLVVDDFGTGYSSLSYLRRFPVDVLKVDQSFVDGLGRDPGDSAIVTAVVTLAHTLGLHAVAEGVETTEQLSELRRLGCDSAQGFYFAKPANGHDIGELLERRHRW